MHRSAIAVLASGRGSNLKSILEATKDPAYPAEVRLVLSDVADAPALGAARAAGIDALTIDPERKGPRLSNRAETSILSALDEHRIRCLVLAGFMRILPAALVAEWEGRMLNIHPSLLPKYRGLHTYRRVLQAGERWHGSTVHFVIPELDAGPAIVQYRVEIRPDDSEQTLMQRVQEGEYRIYPMAIGWIAAGRVSLEGGKVVKDGAELIEPVLINECEQ